MLTADKDYEIQRFYLFTHSNLGIGLVSAEQIREFDTVFRPRTTRRTTFKRHY